ncbi:MAG: FUSC family protein [Candidatus Nanopelagicales bacterium]
MRVLERLPRITLLVALLSIPALIAQQMWLPGSAGIFLLGSVPSAIAVVLIGPRRGLQIAVAAAVGGALAAGFAGNAWVGAAIIAGLAGYGGYSARYGNESPILLVPVVIAFIVISPPDLATRDGYTLGGFEYAAVVGVSLLIGGVWVAILGLVLTRKMERAKNDPVERSVAIGYGIALAASTGIATFVAAYYSPGSTGAWVVLTILLVMKPRPTDMWRTARHRVGGTLVGAAIAAVLVIAMDQIGISRVTWSGLLGAVFLILALGVLRVRPYWQFVMLLTPAIILLKSSGDDTLNLDALRVVMTIIGTVIALLFAVVVREINFKISGAPSGARP